MYASTAMDAGGRGTQEQFAEEQISAGQLAST